MEDLNIEEVAAVTKQEAMDTATKQAYDELERMRDNSVSKEEYNKLKEANEDLTRRLAKERPVIEEQTVVEPSQEDLYKRIKDNSNKIAEGNLNGYEYAKLLTENEDLMEKLGLEYFNKDDPQAREQAECMEATSNLLRKCLEDCGEDPKLFESLMESRTKHTR